MIISIEQRLQDPKRFLIMPADEALIIGLPLMMGLMGRHIFTGIIIAGLAWAGWRALKGEGGVEMLLAATYWYLPTNLGGFAAFPDSSVDVWEA